MTKQRKAPRRQPASIKRPVSPAAPEPPKRARIDAARLLLSQAKTILMRYPRVRGVGVGLRRTGREYTGEIAFVVVVARKDDPQHPQLDEVHRLPKSLFGIPVDVQQLPQAHLKNVAGGGLVRRATSAGGGHIGLVAKDQAGRVHALTAMHVFDDQVSTRPLANGPYFDVEARMFVGPFQTIGKLLGGEFDADTDIANVLVDAGLGSSSRLLGTDVELGRPPPDVPFVNVEIAVPGVPRLSGHLAGTDVDERFPTATGIMTFRGLLHFRIAGQGIEDGWSGSVVFDPATQRPLSLLSFGTDTVDADGFSHVYGFPLAAQYEQWGLRPL